MGSIDSYIVNNDERKKEKENVMQTHSYTQRDCDMKTLKQTVVGIRNQEKQEANGKVLQ
jgi:hypothetical protein